MQKKSEAIQAILANDETSTDQELVTHFVTEFGLSETEARELVAQREAALKGAF